MSLFPAAPKQPERTPLQYHFFPQRTPRAIDDSKPSLVTLESDILTLVADLLEETLPNTLVSVSLVNQWLHSIARYSQHRRITLTSRPKTHLAHLHDRLSYMERGDLFAAVRTLVLDNIGPSQIQDVCRVIPQMAGLRDLHYLSCADWHILNTLKVLSNVRIHVAASLYLDACDEDEEEGLNLLQGCSNLISLEVRAIYAAANGCKRITQPLKRILLACPNLRSLTLDISLPKSGCTTYGIPNEYCGFGFVHGECPPPLEELRVIEYPFGYGKWSSKEPMPLLYSPQLGYPSEGREEDYWAENFNWSRLKHVTLPSGWLALKLMPKLRSLKEITFNDTWSKDQTSQFFREVPAALESISVSDLNAISLEGLLRHGCALRKLQIHRLETYQGGWRRMDGSLEDLCRIRDQCAQIEELNIDVARCDDWPTDVLGILASFPRLRHLEVWFELGIDNSDNPVKPYVTFEAAAAMFKYLREESPKKPSPLKTLKVHSGAPPPLGYGYPARGAFWPSRQSTTFTCELSERDDEATQGIFTISHPALNAKSSELEEVVGRARRSMVEPHISSQRNQLGLALDGPLPISVWMSRRPW